MTNPIRYIICTLLVGCGPQISKVGSGPVVMEVWKNQKLVATAGADDLSVLNIDVSALGPLGKESVIKCNGNCSEKSELYLWTKGLTGRKDSSKDELLTWIEQEKLQVGDTIEIKIRNDVEPDPPIARVLKEDLLTKMEDK